MPKPIKSKRRLTYLKLGRKRPGPGRPFPPGVSGNPRGRPRGSGDRTLATVAAALEASRKLDEGFPYQVTADCYWQEGRRFDRVTKEVIDRDAPIVPQGKELELRQAKQEIRWARSLRWIQHGWLYHRHTLKAIPTWTVPRKKVEE